MRAKKIGKKYGDLEVIDFLGDKQYLCRCVCGNEIIVQTTELRNDKHRCKTSCGCKKHIVQKNEDYFDVIDSDDKAYLIGLLVSDGNINYKKGTYGFEITLQNQDKGVLEQIKKNLDSDINIREYETKGTFPNGMSKVSKVARLSIHSKKIATKLIEMNITPKKSLTTNIDFENIFSDDLIGSFLRGVYDGDGSIIPYIRKDRNEPCVIITLTGNYEFLKHIQDFLLEKWNVNSSLIDKKKPSQKVYTLSIHGQKSCYDFLKKIYKNNTICIERKYQKYLKAIEILEKALFKTQSTIPSEV